MDEGKGEKWGDEVKKPQGGVLESEGTRTQGTDTDRLLMDHLPCDNKKKIFCTRTTAVSCEAVTCDAAGSMM